MVAVKRGIRQWPASIRSDRHLWISSENWTGDHARERVSMADRIVELEEELTSWQSPSSAEGNQSSRRRQRLRDESEWFESKDECDRLLWTSNKAADILLDSRSQKRELELERTNSLVSELEEATANHSA